MTTLTASPLRPALVFRRPEALDSLDQERQEVLEAAVVGLEAEDVPAERAEACFTLLAHLAGTVRRPLLPNSQPAAHKWICAPSWQ